jgi:hypothetical protein
MERFGEICLPEEAGTLSDIELAAYIKAKSTLLMQLKSSGSENGLALLATELCRRQANDGSWKAGPVYQANYFDNNPEAGSRLLFFGSPAETTAIAVKALITFVQYRESVN